MSTERGWTELKFTRDERLLAGVRSAVEYVAARNGLAEDERASLAAAAEEASRAAQDKLGERGGFCKVTIEEFADRIEVRVEHPADAARQGNGSEPARAAGGAEMMKRVDRMLFESREGNASVTLVKFLSKKIA